MNRKDLIKLVREAVREQISYYEHEPEFDQRLADAHGDLYNFVQQTNLGKRVNNLFDELIAVVEHEPEFDDFTMEFESNIVDALNDPRGIPESMFEHAEAVTSWWQREGYPTLQKLEQSGKVEVERGVIEDLNEFFDDLMNAAQ